MPSRTANQRLAEEVAPGKIGQPLPEYVASKRSALPRWPWHLIAKQLADDTGGLIDVTDTTLRNWYSEIAA